MRKHSILVVLLAGVMMMGSVAYGAPARQTENTLQVPGLQGEVQVKYDAWGIPHIYASSEHDLFFAQGYVTAQDRWWQMEWSRHQAKGQLSAIMGENLVGTDTFLRTLGLRQSAERDWEVMSEPMQAALEAYAAGINAWLADKENPLDAAVEYGYARQLGAQFDSIEPWTPLDTLAFGQAMAIYFEQRNIETELLKLGLIEAGGPLAPILLMPGFDYSRDPIISEPGWQAPTAATPPSVEVAYSTIDGASFPDWGSFPFPTFEYVGSNSWAISGDLTASGMPILANDPHIGQNLPSVWYEVGLHCADCGYDAYGFIFPGAPGILIGHNNHLAWGFTVSGLDSIDVYTLEINPENPNQYRYNDEWRDMEVRTEVIEVANGEPREITIRNTHFGPVIHELVGFEQPLSARIGAAEPSTGLEVTYWLPRATNWEEFQQGFAKFDIAGQNAMYADVEGNIGVITGGRIPIRVAGHDGTLPMDGSTDAYEWQGFIDPLNNPRVFNPPNGYLVAANNAFIRPENFETVHGYYYDFGQRASRIETLLQAQDVHSIESTMQLQTDNFNPAGALVVPVLATIDFGDPDLNAARDWLAEWDYMNEADSARAALFNALWMHLVPLTFDELEPAGGVAGGSPQIFLLRGMIGGAHPLWNNPSLGTNSRDEILKISLERAWAMLVEKLGDDPEAWRWDALHISVPEHTPFGKLPHNVNPGLDMIAKSLDVLLNRSYGVDGGLDSVNNQRWDVRRGDFVLTGAIVSMRMIIDFSDLDNSRLIHELGQSGDPNSPHYDDMSPLWATGQYRTHTFTPDAVEDATERVLILVP